MEMNHVTKSDLWHFSTALYRHTLVKKTLLEFQNRFEGNVNLALLCALLNKQKCLLKPTSIATLHQVVSQFSQQYTKPLRALRHNFKQKKDCLNEYSSVRENLLSAELLLEKQEQQILLETLNKLIDEQAKQHTSLPTTSMVDNPSPLDYLSLYQQHLQPSQPKNHLITYNLTDLNQFLG